MRARSSYPAGEFLVGRPEVIQQLLVGSRFFQGVELLPVQVLHEGIAQQIIIRGRAHDRRDLRQPGALRSPPAPLTHDQLEAARPDLTDHDRLQQPHFLDRGHQFIESVLIEHLPGLARIRDDRPDGELLEVRPGDGAGVFGCGPGAALPPVAVPGPPGGAGRDSATRDSATRDSATGECPAGRGDRTGRDQGTEPLPEPPLLLSHRHSLPLRFVARAHPAGPGFAPPTHREIPVGAAASR